MPRKGISKERGTVKKKNRLNNIGGQDKKKALILGGTGRKHIRIDGT